VTWKIVGSLMAGVLLGRLLNVENGEVLGLVGDFALAALLFAVGFSLGADADLGRKIKGLPKIYLGAPMQIWAGRSRDCPRSIWLFPSWWPRVPS